jgi:hypothetical protein
MVIANIRMTITIRPRVSSRLWSVDLPCAEPNGAPAARRRLPPRPNEVGLDTSLIVSRVG